MWEETRRVGATTGKLKKMCAHCSMGKGLVIEHKENAEVLSASFCLSLLVRFVLRPPRPLSLMIKSMGVKHYPQ